MRKALIIQAIIMTIRINTRINRNKGTIISFVYSLILSILLSIIMRKIPPSTVGIIIPQNKHVAYLCITFSCLYPVSVVCTSFLTVTSASDVFSLLSTFVSLWIDTHSLAEHPHFGHAFNVSSLNNCPHSVHFTCAIIMNSAPQTKQCRLLVICFRHIQRK